MKEHNITSCRDCPFLADTIQDSHDCFHPDSRSDNWEYGKDAFRYWFDKTIPHWCPLKINPIIIKIKP